MLRDVAGEGREAHLDRLPVADVGEHLVEDGQRGRLGRRPQARLVQQRGEAERLQRDRLAARVRPADRRARAGRRGRGRSARRIVGIEQRMARADAAAPRPTTSTGAPFQPRESVPSASVRSIRPVASTAARRAAAARVADGRRTARAGSARPPRARRSSPRDWRLLSSTTSNGSTNSVWPESEASWTIAGHAAARARLDREHGPAAALGDEVLLQVLAQLARADELLELVADALPAGAQLAAQLAQLRRRVVAQVGAVLLDRAVDRLRERRRAPGRPRAASSRSSGAAGLVERRRAPAARPPPCRRRAAVACGASTPPSAACAACSRTSRMPVERRLERLVEQRDRLGRQRLPARDLVGVGRRLELGARASRRARSRSHAASALADRRKLQHVERIRVHPRRV